IPRLSLKPNGRTPQERISSRVKTVRVASGKCFGSSEKSSGCFSKNEFSFWNIEVSFLQLNSRSKGSQSVVRLRIHMVRILAMLQRILNEPRLPCNDAAKNPLVVDFHDAVVVLAIALPENQFPFAPGPELLARLDVIAAAIGDAFYRVEI